MNGTDQPRHVILAKSLMPQAEDYHAGKSDIMKSLRSIGVDWYCLHLPETHSLPQLMQPGETILGVVYGRYRHSDGRPVGRGMLAATDKRLVLVDKKPLFLHVDEITYEVVSGITYSATAAAKIVTVNTRMGDIRMRVLSKRSFDNFVTAVEQEMYKARKGGDDDFHDS
jgi:hypothetical protein